MKKILRHNGRAGTRAGRYFRALSAGVAMAAGALAWIAMGTPPAYAQADSGRGTLMSEPLLGFATAIEPGHITVKDMKGEVYDVIPADRIKIYKNGKPVTLGDLHVGDGFNAQGFLNGRTIRALQATIVDPQEEQRLFGSGPGSVLQQPGSHGVIVGNITDINARTITVQQRDGSKQAIALDDATSFYRVGRADTPSPAHPHGTVITLNDIKVGDMISVMGSMKDGVLAATQLTQIKMQ